MVRRQQKERSYKDTMTLVIDCIREEREDLLKDVQGNILLIGGDRLARYNELSSVIDYLEQQTIEHKEEEGE